MKNPCKEIADLSKATFIERDYCYCPGHADIYEQNHLKSIMGAITIIDGKFYRSGLCPKCWEKYK